MANAIEQTWKHAVVAERELEACLAEKGPLLRNIDHQIAQYRSKCEDTILKDFQFALKKKVEDRLWDKHIRINNRFRKQLGVFREASGKRKLVEKRKTVKHYLDFIKSSQRFYRGYIQSLALNFGGIKELEAVAHKFNLDAIPLEGKCTPTGLRNAVLRSCHQALVRLGDLSRYRETELATKEHNWGPATGYYDLAGTILPTSGISHNQLAVIARTDSNHLRATYYLYRALAVEEPHPGAKGNLEIELKKIHTAWGKGESIAISLQRDGQGPGKALVGWFMRLHALCYTGIDFVEHDELENEVLSQLAIDLKERSLEGTLNKFVLINIAAEYFAGIRLKNAPESLEIYQSFFFYQRLNVKTMFTLLQVLQPELERQGDTEDDTDMDSNPTTQLDQVSAVARRVLPGLRHYSSWLISNAHILTAQLGDTSLSVQIKELWKIYASTLTLLASTFQVAELPAIEYLLDEDEDTIGFKPFENDRAKKRYLCQNRDVQKPKWHNEGVERHHPNVEMTGRIREFFTEGLSLAFDESIPIDLVSGTTTFAYHEEGMPSETQASPESHQAISTSMMIEPNEISQTHKPSLPITASLVDDEASQATSVSVSLNTEAHRMVDNLLNSEVAENDQGSEDALLGNLPSRNANCSVPAPLGPAFEATSSGNMDNDTTYGFQETLDTSDFVRALHKYSPKDQPIGSPRPHLPSIYNSPFAPQAGEATPVSRPSTAKRMSPRHHSQQSSQQKFPLLQPISKGGIIVDSSSSMIFDSSSLGISQTPVQTGKNYLVRGLAGGYAHHGAIGDPVLRSYNNVTAFENTEFVSSEIFKGSTWACSGQSAQDALKFQTPPSGQGTG